MVFQFNDAPGRCVLHEGSCCIRDERVDFCLAIDGICVLVRRLVRQDGATFSQVLEVDRASLSEMATADRYGQRLESCYATLLKKYEAATVGMERPVVPPVDAGEAIDDLDACAGEGRLLARVRAIVYQLGATQFAYQWLRFDGAAPAGGDLVEARYLIGCRPAWMQQYLARLGYMNDPCVTYSRSHIAPALGSAVAVHQGLFPEAQAHDFSTRLVAPVHHRGLNMVGLLQVGNPVHGNEGEKELWHNRRHFRSLSSALLDWYTEHARQQAVSEFRLSESETGVLRILQSGGQARHVADQLGVSIHTVYKSVFPRINRKLGAGRITEAVGLAGTYGLLD